MGCYFKSSISLWTHITDRAKIKLILTHNGNLHHGFQLQHGKQHLWNVGTFYGIGPHDTGIPYQSTTCLHQTNHLQRQKIKTEKYHIDNVCMKDNYFLTILMWLLEINVFLCSSMIEISKIMLYSLHNGPALLHKYTSTRVSDGVHQSAWHNHIWYDLHSGQIVTTPLDSQLPIN